ncbi:MAG: diguanylate cyclase [Spirochaetia bacterium]
MKKFKKMKKNQRTLFIGILLLVSAGAVSLLLQINGVNRVKQENLVQQQRSETSSIIRDLEVGFFSKYRDFLIGLAESQFIAEAFPSDIDSVNQALDIALKSTNAEIAYVLDVKGICRASIGEGQLASQMVGESYEFRPYFTQAMQDNQYVGFASGVTTGRIGVYFSAPLHSESGIVGVLVLKAAPAYLSRTLQAKQLPYALVTKNNVVIAGNREEWLYSGLYPLTEMLLERLSQTRQYEGLQLTSKGILPAGFNPQENGSVSVYMQPLSVMGWKLVSIADPHTDAFLYPQQRGFFIKSSVFLLLIILTATALFVTYYTRSSLKTDLRKLYAAVEQSPETVLMTDTKGRIEYVNSSFERLTGYSSSEALGKTPALFKSGHHDREFYKRLWDTISSGKKWKGEIYNSRKDGSLYWESVLISPVKDEQGHTISYVAFKDDITEQKVRQEAVNHRARVDGLTQVLNRRSGLEVLYRSIAQCASNGSNVTVGFVDVNGLKVVNDTFGHAAGDALIKSVSNGIKQHIRESDSLARLGGDEFLIILPGCTRARAEAIWKKIEEAFAGGIEEGGETYNVSASVGFSELSELNDHSELDIESIPRELIRMADERMYHRKQLMKSK